MTTPIDHAIAIVGMSCKLPVGDTPEQFWRALEDGVEAVEHYDDQTLRERGVPQALLDDPHYVKAGIALPGRQLFDAQFFGIAPREASLMDPQQRLLLEGAYRALEHGGYAPDQVEGDTGVFVGADLSSYFIHNILPSAEATAGDPVQLLYANSSMATQIAYRLDLKGPALDVNTACSTSLVAVHLACRSLLLYECDMALAGGASVQAAEPAGYPYRPDGILSPDGRCRAFDVNAGGVVAGQGVALVLLKRHEDALRDGDTIYALIRGTAINNDGSAKVGYTAPSVDGQVEVLRRALAAAELDAARIGYIECHGTGTALGDPIELTALAEVYGRGADQPPCYLGSLKTNLGHLNSAAGVAGLIKAALCLHHRRIPASLNFTRLTRKVRLDGSGLQVNDRRRDWQSDGQPARAAVSSFGIGGTNAHAVLEAWQGADRDAPQAAPLVLCLSAKTPQALTRKRRQWAAFLGAAAAGSLADACYTANTGRSVYAQRFALAAANREEALTLLRDAPQSRAALWRGAVFVLRDSGAALLEAARAAHAAHAGMRDRLEADWRPLGIDPLTLLDPQAPGHEPQLAALAALHAMGSLWQHWGLPAQAMVGDAIGEFAAACLSGVLEIGMAARLIRARAEGADPSWAAELAALDWSGAEIRLRTAVDGEEVDGRVLSTAAHWLAPRRPEALAAALQAAGERGGSMLLDMSEGLLPSPGGPVAAKPRAAHGGAEARRRLAASAAALWQAGAPLVWARFHGEGLRRIGVPTYPFEPARHWLDAPARQAAAAPAPQPAAALQPRPELSTPYRAPGSELEREVAAIWSELLGIDGIGASDDFFDLGGHSLLATQLNARIHETFGIRLDLDDLFDMPTVAGTAERLLLRQLEEVEGSGGFV
ncbi:beta-ketoacyl synthase N-terminal-like domain-containing protein [Burkholderia gladioli]|uniref:Polyketide synthase n=1 Tax=Burkholderia gladioli (strain BSR3) TaxID=999541 RepID=F2LRR7_BURGS|nr:polyketide synthase [Burkholderia gladioli]AEA65561.1 polyketide synthase [Burkholderia gladioli BSR3]MBW5286688.1 polyketide synthase [Burkholderia gladioli]